MGCLIYSDPRDDGVLGDPVVRIHGPRRTVEQGGERPDGRLAAGRAAVDVGALNPLEPGNRPILLIGGLLILVGVIGKFLAGYAPVWFKGNKKVIGVGMIPRGEVGLIFAQTGLASSVFTPQLFSAVTMMVLVTTFIAPPLLKYLWPSGPQTLPPPAPEGIEELVTKP